MPPTGGIPERELDKLKEEAAALGELPACLLPRMQAPLHVAANCMQGSVMMAAGWCRLLGGLGAAGAQNPTSPPSTCFPPAGKSSFAFAFYMDRAKEERERGVTIACTTKEFFTEKWHYTIIDAPGEPPRCWAAALRSAPAACS